MEDTRVPEVPCQPARRLGFLRALLGMTLALRILPTHMACLRCAPKSKQALEGAYTFLCCWFLVHVCACTWMMVCTYVEKIPAPAIVHTLPVPSCLLEAPACKCDVPNKYSPCSTNEGTNNTATVLRISLHSRP